MRMRRCVPLMTAGLVLAFAWAASADVAMTDRRMLRRQVRAENARHKTDKAKRRAANGDVVADYGSVGLIDGSGLEWFLNTDITFSTTSSASGAMYEASYTTSVTGTYSSTYTTTTTTTSGGTTTTTVTTVGTTLTQLNDAFDGYGTLCVSLTGATGPCTTGDASYTIYNMNGAPTMEGNGRQVDFPVQTIGGTIDVSRKVYVPSGDSFARWLNIVTNNDASAQTVTLITSNNLGSDSSTVITSTSDGDRVAELTDTWVVTGQGNTVTGACCNNDPRVGHVLRGPGGAIGLESISFTDGDDNPYWSYTFDLNPGETRIIMTFAVAQPSKTQAATKAAQVAALPAAALQYMSATEKGQVLNFSVPSGSSSSRGDLNGDGMPDILWRNTSTGQLYAWLMNGVTQSSGTFLTPSAVADQNWQVRGIADFDGDGWNDILWHKTSTGQPYVWFMNGVTQSGGSFLTPSPVATAWRIQGVADFDGDGKPDVLWRNTSTQQLYVWFMNGVTFSTGSFLTPSSVASVWQIKGLDDFNADGKTDILWYNTSTGQVYVWFMDGAVQSSGSFLTPSAVTDKSWQIMQVGEFGSGVVDVGPLAPAGGPDILWRNTSTGQLYVWYMNGVNQSGGAFLNPSAVTDKKWQITP
jgi:FG-GAP-like repeat/FG-GAP repeat